MWFTITLLLLLLLSAAVLFLNRYYLQKRLSIGHKKIWWVELSKELFPVLVVVIVIRSFVIEPFKIPSASMKPTLIEGDFILVSKFYYGLRIPVSNYTFLKINRPKRGDVVVFYSPSSPDTHFIKRVIGLPGDHIVYKNKQLSINNEVQALDLVMATNDEKNGFTIERYKEKLGEVQHDIFLHEKTTRSDDDLYNGYLYDINALYSDFETDVPEDSYFVMGDNRDKSNDSRYWGTVPDKNLVGKAFYIWFNWNDLFSLKRNHWEFQRMGKNIE